MNRTLKILLVLIAIVLLGVMVYSSYKLIDNKIQHDQDRDKNTSLNESYAVKTPESSSAPAASAGPAAGQTSSGNESGNENQSFFLPGFRPGSQVKLDDEVSPLNSMYDLGKFYSDYPDAIGWIYCPGTPIDSGIVEANDNSYYLHRFYDGSYSVGGSLFADCSNARDFSDRNTVIYGHHMNDGSKFARVAYYKDQYYYDEHPIMYINTPTMNYRVELFSAFLTDADSEVYTFHFDSDEAYEAWLQRMKAESDFKCDVQVTAADRVVTLSTCSYEYYDARYIALGKLVPIH
ncbi:MAG: class B sortase [Oscillospiraceae bacterium]|nr:class B sortase [Oscillospiraceae bacterium]